MSTPRTGRKISQLPTLTTASLEVFVVGVSGETTYKLSLDALEDAVINTLSASLDNRVDFLETFSSSYNQFSSSVNAQLNANSASALEGRLDILESFTASYATTGSNTFTNSQNIQGAVTASYFKGDGSALTNVTGALSIDILDEGVYKGEVTTLNFTGNGITTTIVGGLGQVQVSLPTGLISGSSQITAFGFISSSQTIDTSSFATTGSNTFVGNQTITGSLTTTGAITAGTTLSSNNSSGDEGGEINLALPQTNTTLTGSIVIDSYQNKVRIFEGGGNSRGVSLDLSKTPNGVGGELLWKASGVVNAGTFVSLDNIKATVTTSGNRGLSLAAVSTSFTANIAVWYAVTGGINGGQANNVSITTTPSSSIGNYNFTVEGDGSTYNIVDKTNNRFYRITLMIGSAYNNNFISIERLY